MKRRNMDKVVDKVDGQRISWTWSKKLKDNVDLVDELVDKMGW